jgi:RimJ/RimL family protein N-acetyltransferase
VFIIRLANSDDAIDVLSWRNDAQTRAMSWNTDAIDPENHVKWFTAAVYDHSRILLIGEIEDKKIGMVRFDVCVEDRYTWKVNILIAPESRNQGVGYILLIHAISFFHSKLPRALLIAEVKSINTASQKLFEKIGFSKEDFDSRKLECNHLVYKLKFDDADQRNKK